MNRTVAHLATVAVASVALFSGCTSPFLAPSSDAPVPSVQLAAEDTDPVLWDALLADGYRGIPTDNCECVYVPEYTTVDIPGGIWTVTPSGPRLCEDGASGECTGWEFIPE